MKVLRFAYYFIGTPFLLFIGVMTTLFAFLSCGFLSTCDASDMPNLLLYLGIYLIVVLIYVLVGVKLIKISTAKGIFLFFFIIIALPITIVLYFQYQNISSRMRIQNEIKDEYSYIPELLATITMQQPTYNTSIGERKEYNVEQPVKVIELNVILPIKIQQNIPDSLMLTTPIRGIIKPATMATHGPIGSCQAYISGYPDACIYTSYPNGKTSCDQDNVTRNLPLPAGDYQIAYTYAYKTEGCNISYFEDLDMNKFEYKLRTYDEFVNCAQNPSSPRC